MAKEAHALRFMVVAQNGRASPPWRVWANRGKSDVYFAHRELAGELKGSLHETGSWQIGLTKQRAKAGNPIPGWASNSRHMRIWSRPPEFVPGLTRAVSIYIPTSELQDLPPTTDLERCIEIPAAPIDQGIEITFFFAKPSASLGGHWPGERDANTKLLAQWDLPSQESFYIVYRQVEVPTVMTADIAAYRRQFSHLKDSPTARARVGIFGFISADGSAFITDAAIHADPPT